MNIFKATAADQIDLKTMDALDVMANPGLIIQSLLRPENLQFGSIYKQLNGKKHLTGWPRWTNGRLEAPTLTLQRANHDGLELGRARRGRAMLRMAWFGCGLFWSGDDGLRPRSVNCRWKSRVASSQDSGETVSDREMSSNISTAALQDGSHRAISGLQ